MNKSELYGKLKEVINKRFNNVSSNVEIQPFSGNQNGSVKIVTLYSVGYEMVENLEKDIEQILRDCH